MIRNFEEEDAKKAGWMQKSDLDLAEWHRDACRSMLLLVE